MHRGRNQIYSFHCLPETPGVSRDAPLSTKLGFGGSLISNIEPKLNECQKTSRSHQRRLIFGSFFNFGWRLEHQTFKSKFSAKKGYLQHFGSKIAKIVKCYRHNLGQSEKNIFDFSLCVIFLKEKIAWGWLSNPIAFN